MGFIIKIIESGKYLIPDGDGWMKTTESKSEAIKLGQLDDKESAELTACSYSKNMEINKDFILEEVR